MFGTVAELLVKIGAETTGLQKGFAQAEAQIKGFKKIGNGLSSFGADMTKFVTVPLLAAGAVSAKFAVDFQQQMEMIHTQAGASQREVDNMSKAVLNLAKVTPQGPDELAKGLYHIESVGVRGAAALNVLKVAAQGAAVGNSNLEDTANALAGAWVTGIKGVGNMSKAMAILNATTGAGNMRMQDLASSFSSGVLPAARTFGLGLHDVTAALALLSDEAVPPQVAATRLRMTFSLLGAPSKQAAKELHSIGISGSALANAMRGKQGLIGALQILKDHLHGLSATKQSQILSRAFGGGRSGGTIMSLVNNLDRLKMKYNQIGKTAGHFSEDVTRTQETAAFRLKKAWSSVQVAMIQFGAVLLPVFVTIANAVATLAGKFSTLSPAAQRWVTVGLAILAVIGPLLFMMGKMIIMAAQVRAALIAMGLAEDFALGPILLIVAGIALLVAGLVYAYTHCRIFHNAVDAAFHGAVSIVRAAIHGIIAAFHMFASAAGAVVSFVRAHWRQLILAIGPLGLMIDFVTRHWSTFKSVGSAAIGLVVSLVKKMGSIISSVASAAAGPLHSVVGFFSSIAGAIQQVIGWIGRIHWPSPPGWVSKLGGAAGGAAHFLGIGATGGVVTRPTRAIIGEAGPEAVIPLNRTPGSSPLPAFGGGGGGATVINLHFHGVAVADRAGIRQAAQMLKPELDRIITVGR